MQGAIGWGATQQRESQAFWQWLIGNWSSTLSIWTVLLFGYIGTLMVRGWGRGAEAAEEGRISQSLGYYALFGATVLMAIANKLRNVSMVRGTFFLFGVLQAAVTLQIGVSPDLPIPRMLEIESELGLEFITNLVVTAQLVLVDFQPVPRFLFLGMHTICLVPFYMRVISYSMLAASLRAVGVYTFEYLAYAIIKQQLDGCFVQHQERLQAEAFKASTDTEGHQLSAQTSRTHVPRTNLWPSQKQNPIVGRGTRVGPLQQQHGRSSSSSSRSPRGGAQGQQEATMRRASNIWQGNCGIRKQQSGSGDEQEHRTGLQGAHAAASFSAPHRKSLLHRTQVFLKVYGSFGPEALHSDALAQMKDVLAVRLPSLHAVNLAVRKGSLILALDLLEPMPSRPHPGAAQQHKQLQCQHEQDSLLCKELQAAAFEWCQVSGLSSLLATGNVLTLQVNNQLRSCFWDATLSSWTSELSTELPNHSAHHIALSRPALFLPHAPASLQQRQQQRQQQLGGDLLPHQQLHMDVTFQACVSMPVGCTLVGWDYTCATPSHFDKQQQQSGEQHSTHSTHSSDSPNQLQLLARTDGSYLPVSILNGSLQLTQAPCEHELQAQVSLPLSLVQQDGCCPLTLELWSASDACSLLHPTSSSCGNGNGGRDGGALNCKTGKGKRDTATHHQHQHRYHCDLHLCAPKEAKGASDPLSSSAAQGVQASSWMLNSSEHSSAVGALEQEAAMRTMVSNWLDNAPPPPTPHNYTHAVAFAPLLLLPSRMVQEVAELETWASGLSDPSQPPPSPDLVQAFLSDLGSWMQFANNWTAVLGYEGKGAGSSSADSDPIRSTHSNGSDAQALLQTGAAGVEGQLPAASPASPAGAAGAEAACCPKQPFLRRSDRMLQDGRAGAEQNLMAQHAASAPLQKLQLARNSTTANIANSAAGQPQQRACDSGNNARQPTLCSVSAVDERLVGEQRKKSERGAVIEAMAEVGRALLHQATQFGLASLAALIVHHLMRPPFGKPFAWVVSEREEEQALSPPLGQVSETQEAAPAEGKSKGPREIADATRGACAENEGSVGGRGSGSNGKMVAFAEPERDSPVTQYLQRASDGQAIATAHAHQGLGQGGKALQRATIGGPFPRVGADGQADVGKAKPPAWMRTTNSSGSLPTCFFYSPFATTAAPKNPPVSDPRSPAAAAAASASITAPHSTTSREGERLHTRSSPLALLQKKPKPAVHQQQLLHSALLSGQPHMVAAVLSWGHAQPNWVWRLDQENAKGVSPRSLAQLLPQRDELLPLLLSSGAPPSLHPQSPHQATPAQARHQDRGTSRHNITGSGQSQGQITQGEGQRGVRWVDEAPTAAATVKRAGTQRPNLARRGWFPGAEAPAAGGVAAAPAAAAGQEPPYFAHKGWFQDAAAAAYAARTTGPHFARRGWYGEVGQLQQGSLEISSVPEEEQPCCPKPGPPQDPHQRVYAESGSVAGGSSSSASKYTGHVASALPSRLANYARSSAPDQHAQQGSSARNASWLARCSVPEGGKAQGAATTMSSMAASLAHLARRSRGYLLSNLDSSHGQGGTAPSHMSSVSSVTASTITPSSTMRPSVVSHSPSSLSHPSPLGNSARAGTSSTGSALQQQHACPPTSCHSPRGRGTVSRLGGQATTTVCANTASTELQEGCRGGGAPNAAAAQPFIREVCQNFPCLGRNSRSPSGSSSSPWVVALGVGVVGVVGLAVAVLLYLVWQGLWGSDSAMSPVSGGNMTPEVDLALVAGGPACQGSGGGAGASMMSCLTTDQHHTGSEHATGPAPAAVQSAQEGAGRCQREVDGGCSQQQQEAGHLLEVLRLSTWEQMCVLLEYCIPLTFSQSNLGNMTSGARKASMAMSKVSYLHLAYRAGSADALHQVLWIAYADILVMLFINTLSKQVQAPRALSQLVMRTAMLVLLFMAQGQLPGQALLFSVLLGGGVVTAATMLMSKLAG